MGDVPLVPLAALMALISPASEEVTKSVAVPKKTSKALGTSRSELPVLETFLQMNPEEKFDLVCRLLLEKKTSANIHNMHNNRNNCAPTHQEAATRWRGASGQSVTDPYGKFQS